MPIPSRPAITPWADGDTVTGADLEADIGGLHSAIAALEDVNVASAAGISGTKLADLTIPGAKLVDGAISTVKIADLQVTQAKIAANAVTLHKTGSAAVDILGFTSFTNVLALATLTTGDPAGPVILIASMSLDITGGTSATCSVRFVRGTTAIKTYSSIQQLTGSPKVRFTHVTVDTGASASTGYAYGIEAQRTALGGSPADFTLTVHDMLALELRR